MYYDDFLVWNLKSYKLKNKRLLEIVVLDGLIITKKKKIKSNQRPNYHNNDITLIV